MYHSAVKSCSKSSREFACREFGTLCHENGSGRTISSRYSAVPASRTEGFQSESLNYKLATGTGLLSRAHIVQFPASLAGKDVHIIDEKNKDRCIGNYLTASGVWAFVTYFNRWVSCSTLGNKCTKWCRLSVLKVSRKRYGHWDLRHASVEETNRNG